MEILAINHELLEHCKKLAEEKVVTEVKEVDLDNEIDKWWCSQYTGYKMKRVPGHKFIPEPAFMDETLSQTENGKTKIGYELDLDWQVDSDDFDWDSETIRKFAKYFYELGLKAQKGE